MRLHQLARPDVLQTLAGPGLLLRVGPFTVRVRSSIQSVVDYLYSHYGQFPVCGSPGAHFTVDVAASAGLRRWIRRQAVFVGDGHQVFYPLPVTAAPALFEWGFNWCVASRVHHLFVIHSAVVSREGRAVLLPAPPESGKSTLCAALVAHGWQLGSDEFALVDPETAAIYPLPRPISLKNAASDIIAGRWRDAHFGPEVLNPQGTRIRYLRPPADSVVEAQRVVHARWIAIPRYRVGSPTIIEASSRARMLAHLAGSSYNYSQFGRRGFDCLAAMSERAEGFTLTYSNIDEALAIFDRLSAEACAEADLEQDTRHEESRSRAGTAA